MRNFSEFQNLERILFLARQYANDYIHFYKCYVYRFRRKFVYIQRKVRRTQSIVQTSEQFFTYYFDIKKSGVKY